MKAEAFSFRDSVEAKEWHQFKVNGINGERGNMMPLHSLVIEVYLVNFPLLIFSFIFSQKIKLYFLTQLYVSQNSSHKVRLCSIASNLGERIVPCVLT